MASSYLTVTQLWNVILACEHTTGRKTVFHFRLSLVFRISLKLSPFHDRWFSFTSPAPDAHPRPTWCQKIWVSGPWMDIHKKPWVRNSLEQPPTSIAGKWCVQCQKDKSTGRVSSGMRWLRWTMMKVGPSQTRFVLAKTVILILFTFRSMLEFKSRIFQIPICCSTPGVLAEHQKLAGVRSMATHTHSQLGTSTRIDTWQQYCTVLEPKFGPASHRNMVQFSEWWVIEVLRSGSGRHLKPDSAAHVQRGDIQLILLDPLGKLLDDKTKLKWWRCLRRNVKCRFQGCWRNSLDRSQASIHNPKLFGGQFYGNTGCGLSSDHSRVRLLFKPCIVQLNLIIIWIWPGSAHTRAKKRVTNKASGHQEFCFKKCWTETHIWLLGQAPHFVVSHCVRKLQYIPGAVNSPVDSYPLGHVAARFTKPASQGHKELLWTLLGLKNA